MKVLIFNAAVSAVALAAVQKLAEELRSEGHQPGVRSLPHFRREKEPADAIVVALTPTEAGRFRELGVELVQVFGTEGELDKFIPLELPEDPEELKDFDFSSVVKQLDGDTRGFMTLDQLRVEAIERGLEVTASSTREHLEHLIGVDIHGGRQAADRITDAENATGTPLRDRIGLRTSTILPTGNGLDFERMNDEQLFATATKMGLRVPKGAKRETLINKMVKTFAENANAPENAGTKSPAETVEADHDLAGKSEDDLKQIAEQEGIDVGRASTVDGLTAKIVEGRQTKANEEAA